MSGSLGTWPISPAAKPANPAPSLDEVVEVLRRDELRARARVHVDELREEELDPALLFALSRISSRVGAVVVAWPCGPPSVRWPRPYARRRPRADGG